MAEAFRVWVYYQDGTYREVRERTNVQYDSKRAIGLVNQILSGPKCAGGEYSRVMITDRDDLCTFDWQYGKGVVFPTKQDTDKHRQVKICSVE